MLIDEEGDCIRPWLEFEIMSKLDLMKHRSLVTAETYTTNCGVLPLSVEWQGGRKPISVTRK